MIIVQVTSADKEDRPGREDTSREENWQEVAHGATYREALENLVEAANNEIFTTANSWLRIILI